MARACSSVRRAWMEVVAPKTMIVLKRVVMRPPKDLQLVGL